MHSHLDVPVIFNAIQVNRNVQVSYAIPCHLPLCVSQPTDLPLIHFAAVVSIKSTFQQFACIVSADCSVNAILNFQLFYIAVITHLLLQVLLLHHPKIHLFNCWFSFSSPQVVQKECCDFAATTVGLGSFVAERASRRLRQGRS